MKFLKILIFLHPPYRICYNIQYTVYTHAGQDRLKIRPGDCPMSESTSSPHILYYSILIYIYNLHRENLPREDDVGTLYFPIVLCRGDQVNGYFQHTMAEIRQTKENTWNENLSNILDYFVFIHLLKPLLLHCNSIGIKNG